MNIGIFFTIPTQLVKYFNEDIFVNEKVNRKYFVKNCGTIITRNGNIWRYIIGESPTHGVRLDKAWVSNLISKDFLYDIIYPCFSKEPEVNYFYEEKVSAKNKKKGNFMKITKVVLEPKYEVASIICDKCKKEYSDELEIQEFLRIHIFGGYASVFDDGNEIESDICQHCLKEWLGDSYRVTDLGDW